MCASCRSFVLSEADWKAVQVRGASCPRRHWAQQVQLTGAAGGTNELPEQR